MTCFYPISAYRSRTVNKSGKIGVTFNPEESNGQKLKLPCSQCRGCRLDRSRSWAIRCVHEAQCHGDNSFITLTYNDEHLPHDCGLDKTHWQKFMKRLRKAIAPTRVRYFHAGEYGTKLGRPHYHACLFGYDFPDRKLFKTQPNGVSLYTSQFLSDVWGKGYVTVGDVTFESAAYVARYIMKKVNGEAAEDHYYKVDPITGELFKVEPEYTTMSRRPGIGAEWYKKFKTDVYPSDQLVIRSKGKMKEVKPPKYYDSLYEIEDPEAFAKLKKERNRKMRKHRLTDDQLRAREEITEARLTQLKRGLDDDPQHLQRVR